MKPAADPVASDRTPSGVEEQRYLIHCGLKRSFYAVLVVSVLVGLLTAAALWLSREIRQLAQEADDTRKRADQSADIAYQTSTTAASQRRKVSGPGQRIETLRIVAGASRVRLSRKLRDEALSALLLPDAGTNLLWYPKEDFEVPFSYDPGLQVCVQNCDRSRAIVHGVSDDSILMDEPGFGRSTCFAQFSPDGRLAAIAFTGGHLGVWDWRRKQLVTQVEQAEPKWGQACFDFGADSQKIWFLATNGSIAAFDFVSKDLTNILTSNHASSILRLSPSGRFVALAGGSQVEIWDLTSRTQHASLWLNQEVWCLAWHPNEEQLGIGCYGGLSLWDIGLTNKVLRVATDTAVTKLFFNRDGDFLLEQGWNRRSVIWDVRTKREVFESGDLTFAQFDQHEDRVAVYGDKRGYGLREFYPRCGTHIWPGPPSLGGALLNADMDPHERWLLTSHARGWLIRDAVTGRELARCECGRTLGASFNNSGTSVLAWTDTGLESWTLSTNDAKADLRVGEGATLWVGSDQEVATCFASGRRYAARSVDGVAAVVDVDDATHPIQFKLKRPYDNSIYLSPDGAWLLTGRHNQPGMDVYDTRKGQFCFTLNPERFDGFLFNNATGELYSSDAYGYALRQISNGVVVSRSPWRVPGSSLIGFSTQNRLALIKTTPSSFSLLDLDRGSDFATLDFRDNQTVLSTRWSADGQRIFLFAADGAIIRIDLQALRRELAGLGLNWSDDAPGRAFPNDAEEKPQGFFADRGQPSLNSWILLVLAPARLASLVSAALLVTIIVGLYIVRYQRRLFSSYLQTEAAAVKSEADLRDAQTALLHNEKMKALGTLAAGVAHDFNNLLSVVRLSSELIEEQTQPTGAVRENFEAIQQAVLRGKGIVNSMLGYAREDDQTRAFVVADLVSEAVALLSKPFLSSLILRVEVESGTPVVFGRKSRVEQMLLNLIVNGCEAMQRSGTLTLGARLVTAPGKCILPPRAGNRWVEVTVRDTGPGVPPEVLPRIFEPFFTTKTTGSRHGTGLGLSMLYAMAQEDGIGVGVDTEVGKGTTFRLLLPVVDTRAPAT